MALDAFQPKTSPSPKPIVYPQPAEIESTSTLDQLVIKVEELTAATEKMNLAEYLDLLQKPRRLLYINFIAGVARGVGIAVGFALFSSVLIYFLQKLVVLNLPVIGHFIAEIVQLVQMQIYPPGY